MTDAIPSSSTPKPSKDSTKPASASVGLVADTGAHTPPAATAAAEAKAFADPTAEHDVKDEAAAIAPSAAQLAADADALLRNSLETIRAKAEDLRRQTTDWAGVRGDQARELIDERPLTVVAAAFAVGLLVGLAARR